MERIDEEVVDQQRRRDRRDQRRDRAADERDHDDHQQVEQDLAVEVELVVDRIEQQGQQRQGDQGEAEAAQLPAAAEASLRATRPGTESSSRSSLRT